MSKICIVGAGPGGLSAGLLLLEKGHEVHIFEKDSLVGGRSKKLTFGEYKFDSGPTFFMHPPILEEVFKKSGMKLGDHINLIPIEPLYDLYFENLKISPSSDKDITYKLFENIQEGSGKAYLKWYDAQQYKFNKIMPILKKPFPNVLHFLRTDVLRGSPVLHPFQSVFDRLNKFFSKEEFIHSLSFQAKYLGMSSYEAPSVFTFLSFLEHNGGLYHVEGGLNNINEKMSQLFKEKGGFLHLNTEVKNFKIKNKKIVSIETNNDTFVSDYFVVNADFAYAMLNLVDKEHLKKFNHRKINKMKYSVSALMVYVGLDKVFDFNHHNVFFSKDYEKYLRKLTSNSDDLNDMSFYMHNPSKIDSTLAPKNHSSIYLLMPVPNNDSGIDWEIHKEKMFNYMCNTIKTKTNIDISKNIKQVNFTTPLDWQVKYNVHKGAVFSLSHRFDQMLHKRPQNNFKDIDNMYLVGGGTHPGSGLPTIYQSALITSGYFKNLKNEKK